MALDGITTAAIAHELRELLTGARIDKIHQPTADEIRFNVRKSGTVYKILVSANPGNPRMHVTHSTKENPMTAPLFCMVLRKHLQGGKILSLEQPNFERILILKVESTNEMGDLTVKNLILEIMGKHSNLILTDENGRILDAIKRITHEKSSVREVLPGGTYVFPPSQDKKNPMELDKAFFLTALHQQEGRKLQDFLYKTYTGISPMMASEVCARVKLDASNTCQETTVPDGEALYETFQRLMGQVGNGAFQNHIFYQESGKIVDFAVLEMEQFASLETRTFASTSLLLEAFYQERDNSYQINQKSHDLRRLVQSNIERCVKKKDIQLLTRKDVKDMDIWKKKGELLTANIYAVPQGVTTFRTIDFYDENMGEITISLDPVKTPAENAQRYFSRYNKAKRTLAALEIQEKQNAEELNYLESVLNALENAKDNEDLAEIRTELVESGFLKRHTPKKGKQSKPQKSKPMRFLSSDGYEILVGKSNLQNDELTLRIADSTDLWLHTKDIPGSHVIIRTNGKDEVPPATLEEAANLAAFHSKAKGSSMVPVDYTQRKHVKKPNGAKPGMVIYLTNRTIYITPDEGLITKMKTE